jgi:hypothetical protein
MERITAAKRTFLFINQELQRLEANGADPAVVSNLKVINEELSDSVISLCKKYEALCISTNSVTQ